MSNFGRSIKLFFADGTPSGLRHVEIFNWSGQALACPRSRFSELKNWEESQRPGVYFLFEGVSTSDKNVAYIGESEDVFTRLSQHDRKKEFWNEVVIFSSKDENLTKSHIKYLESRLVKLSRTANRYELENGNTPTKSTLPRADRAAMEEFIENIQLVLGSLGHKILEPLFRKERIFQEPETLSDYELKFRSNKLTATGAVADDGFILFKGSQISKNVSNSFPANRKSFRDKLIHEKVLIDKGDFLELMKDTIISSSSFAAALIAGGSRSGPQSWKTENGETLKSLEEKFLNS